MAAKKRQSAAVKAERKRQRSEAAKRGWETRRAASDPFAALASALSNIFQSPDWSRVTGRPPQGFRPKSKPKTIRAIIKKDKPKPSRKPRKPVGESTRAKWDRWIETAREEQPNLVVHIAPEAMDHDPDDPKTIILFQTLTVYTAARDMDHYQNWLGSGDASEAYTYWSKTGRLPPVATSARSRFDTKVYRRSPNQMLSGVFAADFAAVEAVRVMPRDRQKETVAMSYARKTDRWTLESRAKALTRARQKGEQK